MKTYRVKKIFGPTIQGEGAYAGAVTSFIRFAGCNRWTGLEKDRATSPCYYCDTDFRGGDKLTAQSILSALNALGGPKRVVLSGGEPALQIDQELIDLLWQDGWEIHLETNGSIDLPMQIVERINHITVSPKQSANETKLRFAHTLKLLYPLPDAGRHPTRFRDKFFTSSMYLQPVMDLDYQANLKATVDYVITHPEWRLSLQNHKAIGVE